jgi:hypothetical protein
MMNQIRSDEPDTEWELDDDEFKTIEVKPEIKLKSRRHDEIYINNGKRI